MDEKHSSHAAAGDQGSDFTGAKTRILIAMDGSKHSFHAFDWYIKNMHKPNNELLVAYCSDFKDHIMWTPVMSTDPAAVSKMIEHCEEEVTAAIAQIKHKLASHQVDAELLRLSGDPGSAIVKAASEHRVTYVVTGSRGLGKVRRTLLGSVSSYVVHHSHIPVLVCHDSQ